ncbi:hypothetical protein C8F01DRAFT_1077909 [Mycena amicta]|nr:hypothetical protein C8F01DRAFT_1077909 [Mycena amicta]
MSTHKRFREEHPASSLDIQRNKCAPLFKKARVAEREPESSESPSNAARMPGSSHHPPDISEVLRTLKFRRRVRVEATPSEPEWRAAWRGESFPVFSPSKVALDNGPVTSGKAKSLRDNVKAIDLSTLKVAVKFRSDKPPVAGGKPNARSTEHGGFLASSETHFQSNSAQRDSDAGFERAIEASITQSGSTSPDSASALAECSTRDRQPSGTDTALSLTTSSSSLISSRSSASHGKLVSREASRKRAREQLKAELRQELKDELRAELTVEILALVENRMSKRVSAAFAPRR